MVWVFFFLVLYRIADLEAGTKNSTPFEEWQASMRKKDLDAQLAEVERRRLMGKLSYEEAILAKQNLMQENRNKVAQMKKEVSQISIGSFINVLVDRRNLTS